METVKFDNVTKMYGETFGIKDLNLEIEDEEFFVLVGPSGAGKTTTLKTVAGILQPTEGRVYINGRLSNLISPNERNVSMTFESYALYPHFSVFDNIANPLRSPKYKKTEAEVETEVKRIAEMLEIGHLLSRKPGELIGGQKQRVSLGRAMEAGSFKGTVYAFNPFVTYGVLILQVNGIRFRAITRANEHFELDEVLSVQIDPKDIYLFDEKTNTNLIYM